MKNFNSYIFYKLTDDYSRRKNSQYLGVGVALNEQKNGCYVVARFWPTGNVYGQYIQNVQLSEGFKMHHLSLLSHIFCLLTAFLLG
jgi:hypothetical protein